jgi:hypothetical protein
MYHPHIRNTEERQICPRFGTRAKKARENVEVVGAGEGFGGNEHICEECFRTSACDCGRESTGGRKGMSKRFLKQDECIVVRQEDKLQWRMG